MTERRQKYTAEFKRDAVKLVTEQGYAIAEAARNLGLTDLSTFGSAFRGVRRESGLLTGFFGERRG